MDVPDGARSEGAQGLADFPVRRRWAVASAMLEAWRKVFGQQSTGLAETRYLSASTKVFVGRYEELRMKISGISKAELSLFDADFVGGR